MAQLDDLTYQEKKITADLQVKQAQIQEYQLKIDEFQKSISVLERERVDEDRGTKSLELQLEQMRGKIQILERELRDKKDLKQRLSQQEQESRYQNEEELRLKRQSEEEEKGLEAQIKALQDHCDLLKRQNVDFADELERMVQADELIREKLNRRDRVLALREKNQQELLQSYRP